MEEEIKLNIDDKDKIKEVTTTISNKTCQEIIKELSDKEMTESELSERLNLPISTVHYNLTKLVKSGIVKSNKFKYSDKGREIKYYKTVKKRIIIRTITSKRILTLLAVITAGAGGALILMDRNRVEYKEASQSMIAESGRKSAVEAVNLGVKSAQINHHIGLWAGIILLLIVILLWGMKRVKILKDKSKNKFAK